MSWREKNFATATPVGLIETRGLKIAACFRFRIQTQSQLQFQSRSREKGTLIVFLAEPADSLVLRRGTKCKREKEQNRVDLSALI